MRDPEIDIQRAEPVSLAGETKIPIHQEEAFVIKRSANTERVSVRTFADEKQVVLQDTVNRGQVEVTRVSIDREVAEAPPVRTEGDVTIIPVLEERLIVEKRLFLVEEVHLRRSNRLENVELATSVRRTHVAIEREDLTSDPDN